ncbi:MAG: hypothetical protein DME92_10760 [Verrucomicrobia bacterium]|nr:MAG: hypothetical protein DME92_10760 [Verrucomicrobiota bacterium]
MAAGVTSRHAETAQHARLKRLALVWAQAQGFSASAMEVSLPKCRYRADVAAYRSQRRQIGSTVIFECKQALCDLRRDNCDSEVARRRLEVICERRQILETHLRAHYPNLRNRDSLFPEFDPENFTAIGHRGYTRLSRELRALQNTEELFREPEIPVGWGALVESNGALTLVRKPIWHDTTADDRVRFLKRIAVAGTRVLNRQLEVTFEDVIASRYRPF